MPNNLPLEKTRFVGRQQLLTAVCQLVQRPDIRLITLTGPGGSGKTRVALRAAANLLPQFEAGVFFVALAAVVDPELLLSSIARAMRLKETAGKSAFDAIGESIRDQPFLLVLDNFEQIIGAASAIDELLSTCRGLKVLVTSRAVLHLTGEHELPVPPLAVPDSRRPASIEELSENESVVLFVERARSARPEFALTPANGREIVEVCRRLDGLPLALELAAARLRALPLPALLERMEHRLPLLTGGPRDAPARQQTLRDTILWSYDLLSPEEQLLFQRLAVFRGCTLDAVERVCCQATEGPRSTSVALPALTIDPLDGVSSLVEKSLIRREDGGDDQPWYVMLETVREFALERLVSSGDEAGVRRRHALYYMQLAEAADESMHGPRQIKLLNRIEREHANCREALRWCVARGYAEPALRTATALWWFWVVRGYASEGRDWLTELLERFASQGAVGPRSQLRVRALEAAGHLASFQGDFAAARAFHQQNLPVVEEQGDSSGLYRTLQNLGFVARQQEDWQAAREYLERCLAVAREGGDADEIANALHNLANIVHDLGDHALARTLLEECLKLFAQTGQARSEAIAHLSLSLVALDQADYERARAESEAALALQELAGDRRSSVHVKISLANVALAQKDVVVAERHLRDALGAVQEVADPVATAGVLERFAVLMAAKGRPESALRIAGAAAALRASNGAQLAGRPRENLEVELQSARQMLHAAAAANIYEQGLGLTAEQAIAEALGPVAMARANQPGEPRSHLADQTSLTPREQQIVTLIAQGATNRQIADALVIAEGTAANHVLHILSKLGFSSRTQVAVWATQEGLRPAVGTG